MTCGNKDKQTMLKVDNSVNYKPSFTGGIHTIGPKATNALIRIGKTSSVGQRAAQGAAALCISTLIDRFNPWTDEHTRQTSAKRTAAKAIACAATGIVIRGGCIKAAQKVLVNMKKLPACIKDVDYAGKFMGTVLALGVMLFTNFLIDVPLTNKLADLFGKIGNKNTKAPAPQIRTPQSTIPFKGDGGAND